MSDETTPWQRQPTNGSNGPARGRRRPSRGIFAMTGHRPRGGLAAARDAPGLARPAVTLLWAVAPPRRAGLPAPMADSAAGDRLVRTRLGRNIAPALSRWSGERAPQRTRATTTTEDSPA